ncbi:MAG TPA: glycosyltransferase family 2 protein [Oligoflexia bacterium]|nr:glycosyltransferase family 2 protein [Oligoflexia bacterium]
MSVPFTTVILFFNKSALTLRCLKSVYQAGLSENSILLVDNGSTPETASSIHSSTKAPVLRLENNAGFAKGMNLGLRHCFSDLATQWVLALSNDTELQPSFEVDFCNFLSEITNIEAPTILGPAVYHLQSKTLAYTHGRFSKELAGFSALSHQVAQEQRVPIVPPFYYPAAATLWNRRAFEALGGFNERFYCYWEDVDLSYRCAQSGVRLLPAPGLHVYHQGKGTTSGKKHYVSAFHQGEQTFRRLWDL